MDPNQPSMGRARGRGRGNLWIFYIIYRKYEKKNQQQNSNDIL